MLCGLCDHTDDCAAGAEAAGGIARRYAVAFFVCWRIKQQRHYLLMYSTGSGVVVCAGYSREISW